MHLMQAEKVGARRNEGMRFILSEHELYILSTAKDCWQQDQTTVLMTRGGQKDGPILIHSRWLKALILQDALRALLHVWRAPTQSCWKTGSYLLNMITGDTLITVAFRNKITACMWQCANATCCMHLIKINEDQRQGTS